MDHVHVLVQVLFLPLLAALHLLLNAEAVSNIIFKDVGDVLNGFTSNIIGRHDLHIIEPNVGIVTLLIGFFARV